MAGPPMISVVMPAVNAAERIGVALDSVLAPGLVAERIVVDGASTDTTATIARARGATVIAAPRGRGTQLAAGVGAATGDWLLFLHADTVLEPGWAEDAVRFMIDPANANRAAAFAFALDDPRRRARLLETAVAWRCRRFRLPYGDQGLLIARATYDALGGFADLPLYEDVEFVRRVGRNRIVLLQSRAVTAADRYRRGGYLLRPLRNLCLLALYFAGMPAASLARLYGVSP